MAYGGSKKKARNAFDVLMGRVDYVDPDSDDDSIYPSGFSRSDNITDYNLGMDLYFTPESSLYHLFSYELVDPSISYDDFHKRYWADVSLFVDEGRFRKYWWNREFEAHHRIRGYESSYVNDFRRQSSGPGTTIVYDRCREKDLKSFLVERGLDDPYPGGVTMKYYYIRILEAADRDYQFRFMDLPPEMRVLICRHLLLFRGPTDRGLHHASKVFPNILRASSHVGKEAKDVLYKENVFKAELAVTAHDNARVAEKASVHKKTVNVQCAHAEFTRLPDGIDDYPAFFRRISRLEISVKYNIVGTTGVLDDGYWPINHFLYTLASFLMDGHCLKNLKLKVDISGEVEDYAYSTIFYPLLRLRNIPKLTIQGDIPVKIQRKLQQDLKSNEPVFNTLRSWKLLSDEATQQMAFFETVNIVCDCGECPLPTNLALLANSLDVVQEGKLEGCFGSRLEENFIARLAALKDALKGIDVERARKLLESIEEKCRAQTKHESVTDAGRFEEAQKIWKGSLHDEGAMYDSDGDDWEDDDVVNGPEDIPMSDNREEAEPTGNGMNTVLGLME